MPILGKYGIRYGKAFRLRGAGYETLNIKPDESEDEKKFWKIVNAMKPEDAAVIGRIVDDAWYQQNEEDIVMLEGIAKKT